MEESERESEESDPELEESERTRFSLEESDLERESEESERGLDELDRELEETERTARCTEPEGDNSYEVIVITDSDSDFKVNQALLTYEPSSSEDEVKLKPIHKRLRWDSSSEDEGLKIKQMEHSPIKKVVSAVQRAPINDFYHQNKKIPVYSRSSTRFDTQEIINILLDPDLSEDKICKMQPIDVEHNASFVVDISKLKSMKDLYCDDMGSWICNGIYKSWVDVDFTGYITVHGKHKPPTADASLYFITKKYFLHKTSKDLKKTVSFLADYEEDTLNLALVQYCFDGKEHSVTPRPHGNSKKPGSFVRTMPSTLLKLRKVSTNLTAKFAVCESIHDDYLLKASCAGSVPRNRQQAADMRRRTEESVGTSVFTKKKDPLFSVMLMCKESEGGKPGDAFVRLVSGAPEPMTVLTFNWSLNDVERFCTTDKQSTVLCVDPTFNLGDFYVTVTTYRHLMLRNSNGNHPVMMGPIFIHQQKKFETYHFFASALVGLKPSLRRLVSFGTDGEKALSSAFSTVFEKSVHLRCFLHFKGNLESRLREYGIPKHMQVEFLRDIFGDPTNAEDGLVDAECDDDFEGILLSLEKIWNEREKLYNDPPLFFQWFVQNCKSEVKETMIKQLRVKAGLGNPPDPFYTNDVESQNRVIKHQNEYKVQELPQFIESMKTMMISQKKEIQKAIANLGEYRMASDYQHLGVESRKFFQMSENQRERAFNNFFSAGLVEDVIEGGREVDLPHGITPLSSELKTIFFQLPLPAYLAEKVWKETTITLQNETSICPSPGCDDSSQWLVASTDYKRKSPFFVQINKSGQIACEQSCGVFKCSKICVHCISVAYKTNQLEKFVRWFQQKEKPVNFSKLASIGMPQHGGKKSHSHRKASQKKTTKVIKTILQDSNQKRKYRVPPDSKEDSLVSISSAQQQQSPPPLVSSGNVSIHLSSCADVPDTHDSNELQQQLAMPPPPLIPTCAANFFCAPHTIPMSTPPTVQQQTMFPSATNVSMPYSPIVYAPFSPLVQHNSSPLHQSEPQSSQLHQNQGQPRNHFWIVFVKGNISRCGGCGMRNMRTEAGTPHPAPDDICLQHKEYVMFENPRTGLVQWSRDLRNVYYHANLNCVKVSKFDPKTELKVSKEIKAKLSEVHFHHIQRQFGLNLNP